MSPYQEEFLYSNKLEVFTDGTFFSAPEIGYQLQVFRIENNITKNFLLVCWTIMTNKTYNLYKKLLEKIKDIVYQLKPNKRIINPFKPMNIHLDFEDGLIKAIEVVLLDTKKRLCLLHFVINLEKNIK